MKPPEAYVDELAKELCMGEDIWTVMAKVMMVRAMTAYADEQVKVAILIERMSMDMERSLKATIEDRAEGFAEALEEAAGVCETYALCRKLNRDSPIPDYAYLAERIRALKSKP